MYNKFKESMQKIADVGYAMSVLHWDKETYLPEKGARFRSQQLATLAGISHEMSTSKELGDLLKKLSNDNTLDAKQKKNIQETLKDYEKGTKFDTAFVIEASKAVSACFHAWKQAKEQNDFSIYIEPLSKLVELKRQTAEIVGYEEHPYDALMDDYEPNAKTSEITALFDDVRSQLKPLLDAIKSAPQVDDSFMYQKYDKDKQWNFGLDILAQMGYDFKAGRQDVSMHPFTTSFSPEDVRVTTRVGEDNFNEMLWSCIHEGGHALYEQGLLSEDYGLPTGEAISLGVHESQSRLWENNVGRSYKYWQANYPKLQSTFQDNLGGVTVDQFYKAINKVQPSLVRVEADELTYHFHILIRFEIEKALIEGSIEVKDLADYWNAKYKEYLGVDVPSDSVGVLQDIHWSHGSFGYFPTYSLGSFYAAQYYAKAVEEVPNLEADIQAGNMMPMLKWLRENIHVHGKLYTAQELCKNVTGEPLNFKYFMDYANKKYGGIYNLG